jgi:hypothetical protein
MRPRNRAVPRRSEQLLDTNGRTDMAHRIAVLALSTWFLCVPPILGAEEYGAVPRGSASEQPAIEAPVPVMCAMLFDVLDENKDRFITKDEAKKSPRTSDDWGSIDNDRDNRLSFEEFCPRG